MRRMIMLACCVVWPVMSIFARDNNLSQVSAAAIIEKTLLDEGMERAVAKFREMRADDEHTYVFHENDFKRSGNRLLGAGYITEAVEIFRMASELFSTSPDAWNSLGEAYVYADRKNLAVACYEKSLEIDAENETAIWALRMMDGKMEDMRRETRKPFRFASGENTGLTGPYMGQTPPGLEPQVFAPGLVSTRGNIEYACTFSPDGRALYFNRRSRIMVSHLTEDGWTAPRPAPFTDKYGGYEAHITPDGGKMFFGRGTDIWVMEKTPQGWGEAKYHGPGMFVTTTLDGTLYLTDISGQPGNADIVRSRLAAGRYTEPEAVEGDVNSSYDDAHPCIAPDENFLVFDSWRPEGKGAGDFFICFRDENDTWSKAVHLGDEFNTVGGNICATLSPDGTYLFFTKNNDVYWVKAEILEAYRPE